MSPSVLRMRMTWLVFVILFLAPALSVQSKSKPTGSVCQLMYRDGPSMCIQSVDKTLLGSRIPILLIHGWNSERPGPPSPEVWNNLIIYSATMPWVAEKFKFYRVTYYSNLISVSDIGKLLIELVDQMDAENADFARQKLFIIGHSMGGLVARSFMQEYRLQTGFGIRGGERVLRLVTLATPHHGTPVANGPMRDDKAGTLIGYALNLLDGAMFKDAPWSDYNRFDLHADKVLSSLIQFDYPRFIGDQNLWLDRLNADNPYRQKITGYGGSIHTWDDWSGGCSALDDLRNVSGDDLLDCSALLMNGLYGFLWNDGIVPGLSANFSSCDSCGTETLFGYNHSQMAQGLSPNDSYLFGAILGDMSDFASAGDSRFGSSVTMGDSASEAFHNLRGWAEVDQDPAKVVFRNQATEHQAYVDLFVPRAGVPYTLSFKRGGDTCGDDQFYVYVTINGTDVPTALLSDDALRCRVVQGASLYQFQIPGFAIKKNKIRLGFFGWRLDPEPRLVAPMYYIRLDPA